jgi:hypothetical protein
MAQVDTTLNLAEIERRWLEACADAGVTSGEQAHVAPIFGPPPPETGNFAMHYKPGSTINPDEMFPLSKGQREKFNSPDLRDTHRIAVFAEVEPRVLSGLFRHELQHARQFDSHPDAYGLTDFAQGALYLAYGARAGGAVLYNAVPLEQEANAAASRFLYTLDGEPTLDELEGPQAQLFRRPDVPWGEGRLPTETLAFVALHPDELEQTIPSSYGDLPGVIAPLHPNAAELWQRHRGDTELQAMRATFPALIPTDKEIVAAGDRPGDAWQPLSKALVAARLSASAIIRDAT